MNDEIDFNIDSVDKIKRVQNNLEVIAKRVSEGQPIARVALCIERRAKMNATGRPGPNVQTGRLRASIFTWMGPEPVTEAVVGTNVKYAPPVEFGHRQEVGRYVPIYGMRRIGKGQFTGRYEVSRGLGLRLVKPFAPAYPFMQPALEQAQSSGETEGAMASFQVDIERDWTR